MSRSGGFSQARLSRMSDVLRGHVERGEVAGAVAVVSRCDEVHVDTVGVQDLGAGTPMRRDTIFRIASMTKAVTAVAAMILVEETRLRLDDPVDPWLPELADRKVLRAIDSLLDDTVPAHRPITLRDLLTLRLGLGAIMAPPGFYPIQQAMADSGLEPGPDPIALTADDYMKRLGDLPLVHQPGERWLYHTGYDILAVLIARVAGIPLEDFLAERIFEPLGMTDTAFHVPEAKLDRLATCYRTDEAGRLAVYDTARGGLWSQPPTLPSELVSTVDDYLAFARMMLNSGRHGPTRILARPTVEFMTTDQLTQALKDASPFYPGFWDNYGWGFGVSVVTRRSHIGATPGCYGWAGGFGTTFIVDPQEEMIAIFMIQRLMTSPDSDAINKDFLTLAYQAIDD
jgi:CubicO group peptidase (beta-lactamase class C family)